MARHAEFPEETFAAMQRIRNTTLVHFDSLFSPDRRIWSLQNLRQFHALFVARFDDGESSFLEKWKKQLSGADDQIFQLAAELLYVQQFFTSLSSPEKKLENVNAVLGWCTNPPSIPEWAILSSVDGASRASSRRSPACPSPLRPPAAPPVRPRQPTKSVRTRCCTT